MDAPLVVRFHEMQSYDIVDDAQVVTLMATTDIGTYHGRTWVDRASKLREDRKGFRHYVMDCMTKGIPPHEVEIDGSSGDHDSRPG